MFRSGKTSGSYHFDQPASATSFMVTPLVDRDPSTATADTDTCSVVEEGVFESQTDFYDASEEDPSTRLPGEPGGTMRKREKPPPPAYPPPHDVEGYISMSGGAPPPVPKEPPPSHVPVPSTRKPGSKVPPPLPGEDYLSVSENRGVPPPLPGENFGFASLQRPGPPSYNDLNQSYDGIGEEHSDAPPPLPERMQVALPVHVIADQTPVLPSRNETLGTATLEEKCQQPVHRQDPSTNPKVSTKRVHIAPIAKFTLFFSNLLAVVVSLAMMGVGSYSAATEGDGLDLSGFGTNPASILIACGCLIFLVAFCGMVGSLREHLILLRMFHVILLVLLALELTAGLLVYFLRDKVKSSAATQVLEAIKKYETSNKQTPLDDAIKHAQISLQCCGANQPTDWRDTSPYFKCSNKETFQTLYSSCSVPSSCCRNGTSNNQCGYKVFAYPNMTQAEQNKYPRIASREAIIWNKGCVTAVYDWLRANWVTLVIVCGVFVVLEVLGIECARRMIDNLLVIKRFGYLKRK